MYQRQVTYREAIESALKYNYCNFDGRASRSQFWWFYLFEIIVGCVIWVLQIIIGDNMANVVGGLVNLALLLPALGLCVRRLHDVGRSGWWLLLVLTGIGALVLLYWYVQDSQMQPNEYGPVPNLVD